LKSGGQPRLPVVAARNHRQGYRFEIRRATTAVFAHSSAAAKATGLKSGGQPRPRLQTAAQRAAVFRPERKLRDSCRQAAGIPASRKAAVAGKSPAPVHEFPVFGRQAPPPLIPRPRPGDTWKWLTFCDLRPSAPARRGPAQSLQRLWPVSGNSKRTSSSCAPAPMLWIMRGTPLSVFLSLTIMTWGRFGGTVQVTMSPGR
jgi:hypothetical protein